jgi:hypothetical protein
MNRPEEFAQPSIYAGAKAPEQVLVTILQGASGVDLTTVSTAVFQVTNGVDPVATWTAAVIHKQADKLVLRHVFDVDGVETRKAGKYRLIPVLTVTDGVRRAPAFYLAVLA